MLASTAGAGEQPPLDDTRGRAAMQWIGEAADESHGPVFMFAHGATATDSRLVKGAPYSAEATTEFVQTLADGNRIRRTTTASVYRDGEGRTRREQKLGLVGPLGAAAAARHQVLINDPVAGVEYVLDPKERTAHKLPAMRFALSNTSKPGAGAAAPGAHVRLHTKVFEKRVELVREGDAAGDPAPEAGPPADFTALLPGPHMMAERLELQAGQPESLGKQEIEGLEVEGTRTTLTIPAGQIGNEQPLQIVSERWYSPQLQGVVLSRHSDPRFGETTYRLTSIVRAEPQRALFEVPAGYKVSDGPASGDFLYRKIEKARKSGE
jgi:hypothetical protein